jgi:hypothetical protein
MSLAFCIEWGKWAAAEKRAVRVARCNLAALALVLLQWLGGWVAAREDCETWR